jgi:hypothetical protein
LLTAGIDLLAKTGAVRALGGHRLTSLGRTLFMTKLRVHNFTISLDGYGAGPGQDLQNPLGIGGESLHVLVKHK